jgi:hypothetical protein
MVTVGAGPVTGPSTKNPGLDHGADSAPVVTVIGARNPNVAPEPIVKLAVAVVGLVTAIGPAAPAVPPPTEIPAPKLATEVPCAQCVNMPTIDTVTLVPGFAEFGVTYSTIGEPFTVKAFASDSCSAPVLTATVRVANGALAEIVSDAVAVVALSTVTGPYAPDTPVPTATPGPKLASVVPCAKCVFNPVMVTTTDCPASALFGATETSEAAAGAPEDTTMLTAEPAFTDVPELGLWLSTLPAGTVVLDCVVTVPSTRPAPVIAVVAAACVSPTTLGTDTGAGPLDTTRFTAEPRFTNVPAAGFSLITLPAATVLLAAVVTVPNT